MNQVRSTRRVQACCARRRLRVRMVVMEVSDQLVDRLAAEGYLDGGNTVVHALEQLLADFVQHGS
jgi:hypothetical protein